MKFMGIRNSHKAEKKNKFIVQLSVSIVQDFLRSKIHLIILREVSPIVANLLFSYSDIWTLFFF